MGVGVVVALTLALNSAAVNPKAEAWRGGRAVGVGRLIKVTNTCLFSSCRYEIGP